MLVSGPLLSSNVFIYFYHFFPCNGGPLNVVGPLVSYPQCLMDKTALESDFTGKVLLGGIAKMNWC